MDKDHLLNTVHFSLFPPVKIGIPMQIFPTRSLPLPNPHPILSHPSPSPRTSLRHGTLSRYEKTQNCELECIPRCGDHSGPSEEIALSMEEYCGCGCDLWIDLGVGEHCLELDDGGFGGKRGGDGSGSSRGTVDGVCVIFNWRVGFNLERLLEMDSCHLI